MRLTDPRASRRAALALALLLGAPFSLTAVLAAPARKAPRVRRGRVRSDADPDIVTYGRRDDVMRFAAETARDLGLNATWVESSLAEARYLPVVARLIMPPPVGTAKNWAAYRARFIEPERVRAGAAFWRQNAAPARTRWTRPIGVMACRPRSSSASSAWRRTTVVSPAASGCWTPWPR
jgi:membrane-bound lytic murein transglycosylase B